MFPQNVKYFSSFHFTHSATKIAPTLYTCFHCCGSMGKQEPYLPLSQHEAEERILRTSSEASGSTLIENWKSRGILEKREFRPLWLHWVAHGVLTIALIVTFLTSGSRQSDDGCTANQTPNGKNPFIRPSESRVPSPRVSHILTVAAFYDDIELLAEEYPFYYDRKPHVDPFQEKWKGHPNEENEPLWATLTSGESSTKYCCTM